MNRKDFDAKIEKMTQEAHENGFSSWREWAEFKRIEDQWLEEDF